MNKAIKPIEQVIAHPSEREAAYRDHEDRQFRMLKHKADMLIQINATAREIRAAREAVRIYRILDRRV